MKTLNPNGKFFGDLNHTLMTGRARDLQGALGGCDHAAAPINGIYADHGQRDHGRAGLQSQRHHNGYQCIPCLGLSLYGRLVMSLCTA